VFQETINGTLLIIITEH